MSDVWLRGCQLIDVIYEHDVGLYRVEHEGRPAWLVRVDAPYHRVPPPPPPCENLIEVFDHAFADEYTVHVFERFDGLSLRAIADEHYRLIGQVAGARCPECGHAVHPYRTEFGIQVLCQSCGGMFDPRALPPSPRDSRVLWGTPLWPEYAIRIACAGARALAHGHHHGAPFRGVNNQRVIVGSDGVVKLLSPNIWLESDDPTGEGPMIETELRYISPECCRGLALTAASDVYAIAAMLYEMTVGQHPAETWSSDYKLIERVRTRRPERPIELIGGYPAELDQLITRSLELDPSARPSMTGLIDALEAFAVTRSLDVGAAHLVDYLRCLRPADESWMSKVTQ